jgi:hypothetical protein
MKKIIVFMVFLAILVFCFFFIFEKEKAFLKNNDDEKENLSENKELKNKKCTLYINEEYNFSFCYPLGMTLPEEKEILPPQQWLYSISVKDVERKYELNLYDQMLPTALESFIRSYFSSLKSGPVDVFEKEINGKKGVGFYIIKEGVSPSVSLFLSFQKGTKVMVISTPEFDISKKEILFSDDYLKTIIGSFKWLDL